MRCASLKWALGFSFLFFQQKLSPDKIYHMLVAPCFDKKLEAVREDFYNSLLEARDVDCVLTSGLFYFNVVYFNYVYKPVFLSCIYRFL